MSQRKCQISKRLKYKFAPKNVEMSKFCNNYIHPENVGAILFPPWNIPHLVATIEIVFL